MVRCIGGLYGITRDNDPDVEAHVKFALDGGAKVIQYRAKSNNDNRFEIASKLADICREYDVTYIINDDIDLALAVNADGVHLGKNDLDIESARKKIGDKIIGVSCYNKLALAVDAEQLSADYVAFGRFFPSSTKPNAVAAEIELLRDARKKLSIPIVAIGGINVSNAKSLIEAGANSIAVIDGLFNWQRFNEQQFEKKANQENIKKTAEYFSSLFLNKTTLR